MSFSIQQKTKAKYVPIMEWLAKKGFKFVKQSGGEFVFYSPFNPEEKTPSFRVNPLKNVFHDFSSGRKGDVIRLVEELENICFVEAVNRLLDFSGFEVSYEPEKLKPITKGESYSTIQKILPLRSQNLIEYIQNRRIDVDVAKLWLKEVVYTNDKGKFYGIGFQNDKGGFEMRCPTRNGTIFKCFVGDIKTIRTFYTDDNETALLFEGFTDFLSYLTYYKQSNPYCTCFILNSTSMLSVELINILSQFTVVYSYLDNDKTGFEAFEKLEKYLDSHTILVNGSYDLYPDHHDFNDFLRAKFLSQWPNQKQSNNATKVG